MGNDAQARGDNVNALFGFTEYAIFDPSQMEGMTQFTTLASTISGGSITEWIKNDAEHRE